MRVRFNRPFIGGKFVQEDCIKVNWRNPYTQEIIPVYHSKPDHLKLAIESAKTETLWSKSGVTRKKLMNNLIELIKDNAEELSWLESLGGKPIAQAREDVTASIDVFKYFAERTENVNAVETERFDGYTSKIVRSPLGICGLITSFNYPLLILAWKVAPALAAGNIVIIKPSEWTPYSTLYFAHLTQVCGFPDGVVNVLLGCKDIGSAIVSEPSIKKISFTGSTSVGRQIAIQCAQRLVPCTLELGGKNAVIVAEDADIELAVTSIVDANMGQNCCAISRLFIHESVYEQVIGRLVSQSDKLVSGDPLDDSTYIGPLISQEAFDRVYQAVNLAKQDGVEMLLGGFDRDRLIVKPTIFANVDDAHAIARTELFGPVLSILKPFKDTQEVIRRVNDCEYGLAFGLFSKNSTQFNEMVNEIEAGMLWHNTYNFIPPSLPFGGLKHSGIGQELGNQALNAFSLTKSILSRN